MKYLLRHVGIVLAFFVITAAAAVGFARIFAPNDACAGNAKQLYQAIIAYKQDHDECLPPTSSMTEFQAALKYYVTDNRVFYCPVSGKAYLINPNPTGAPDKTILFQDPVPHADGYPTIVYVDGHIEHGGTELGDTNTICADRVKQLSLGMMQYVQDFDEKFPNLSTQRNFKDAILPYARSTRYFTCPATNKDYLPNSQLTYMALAQLSNFDTTYIIIDAQAHNDGIKTIGYLDGHVNRIGTVNSATCGNNQKQLGLALMQYIQDNDEAFPIMTDNERIKSELQPYTRNTGLFNCPENGLPYKWNTSLSGVYLAMLDNPSFTEVLRDSALHADGSLNILYADGHFKPYLSPWYKPSQVVVTPSNGMYMLWNKPGGAIQIWALSSDGTPLNSSPMDTRITSADNIIVDPYSTVYGYTKGDNSASIWSQSITGAVNHYNFGPYDGWTASGIGVGNNRVIRMLWTRYDNTAAVWFATADGRYQWDQRIPAPTGMKAIGFNVCPDGRCIILWSNSTGGMVISKMESSGTAYNSHAYAFTGWKPVAITSDTTNRSYILWSDNNGNASVWAMYSNWTYKQTTYSIAPGWTAVSLAVGSDSNRRIVWHNADGRTRLVVYNQRGTQISAHDYPAMR